MTRYDIYTAIIGIISVFFTLTIYFGGLDFGAKIFLMVVGAAIFFHSAFTLYRSLKGKSPARRDTIPATISQIALLNKNGETISTWELYGKTSMVIGKDFGENEVGVDLGKTQYAAMIDIEHAVLNYVSGSWYIEDLGSQNGISIKKFGQEKDYKLSSLQPCKLDLGDIIYIGVCQLKLN